MTSFTTGPFRIIVTDNRLILSTRDNKHDIAWSELAEMLDDLLCDPNDTVQIVKSEDI